MEPTGAEQNVGISRSSHSWVTALCSGRMSHKSVFLDTSVEVYVGGCLHITSFPPLLWLPCVQENNIWMWKFKYLLCFLFPECEDFEPTNRYKFNAGIIFEIRICFFSETALFSNCVQDLCSVQQKLLLNSSSTK